MDDPRLRKIPELIIGELYYVCFEPPKTHQFRLIDVFSTSSGSYVLLGGLRGGTNILRPYCIGKTKSQAIENYELHNSYSPLFSDLIIKRPYIDKV